MTFTLFWGSLAGWVEDDFSEILAWEQLVRDYGDEPSDDEGGDAS